MERPGDDFKATHNVTIAERDTTFGGQISRLQVAEVIGTAIARTELAENKVGCHTCTVHQYSQLSNAAPTGCVRMTDFRRTGDLHQRITLLTVCQWVPEGGHTVLEIICDLS